MGLEQHASSGIDDVERLHHMLAFAIRISGHAGDIFEIDLSAAHGCRSLLWLMDRFPTRQDSIIGFEDTVNGLAGGNRQLEELEQGISF